MPFSRGSSPPRIKPGSPPLWTDSLVFEQPGNLPNYNILRDIFTILHVFFSKHFIEIELKYFRILSTIRSYQLLSCVQLFAIPWPAAHQTSLSFTISWSLLKLRSVESVMPSNHLILCHILFLLHPIFPSIRVFSSESSVASGGRSMGASTSASVLPMNIPIL